MARVELIMPKMGESVSEATIITWSKNIGDLVELDETIVEIATDKVDSEVPSTHEGKLVEILYKVDDVVQVGEPFAILETEGSDDTTDLNDSNPAPAVTKIVEEAITKAVEATTTTITNTGERFYSPLVRSMASEEGIEMTELESIAGSGKEGRVTKSDMLSYLKNRGTAFATAPVKTETKKTTPAPKKAAPVHTPVNIPNTGGTEIVEMDRMRKLIADHMVMSKHVAPHVTSFVEADVTSLVLWREKNKKAFHEKFGEKLTFTPLIAEAIISRHLDRELETGSKSLSSSYWNPEMDIDFSSSIIN